MTGWLFALLFCVTGCSGADTTEVPVDSAKWLVSAYLRADDRSWGLLDIEKAEKGRSYRSQGEHGVRAGLTVEPTRVTFTGWGFSPESGRLGHYRVVSRWRCYADDFGEQAALPDEHTVTPLDGGAVKGKDVPELGALGMSPQQMERACGAPSEPPAPEPKHEGVTRITYRKGEYNLLGLFYAGRMYSVTYRRADQATASNTDIIVWLLQNGAGWKHELGVGYARADNAVVVRRYNAGSRAAPLDSLEVREAKTHPEGSGGEDLGSPVGRYRKAVSDAVGARWYYEVNESTEQLSGGAVTVRFTVNSAGRVTGVKVASGEANSPLAKLSLKAVREATIPPIPEAVAATLEGKPFEVDYTFSTK